LGRSIIDKCKPGELPEAAILRLSMKLLVFQRLGCRLILDEIYAVSE
jgi:hypothetical protein